MTDFKMTERPGYTGMLNKKIEDRVGVMAEAIGDSELHKKFPHLSAKDSWRKPCRTLSAAQLADYIDHTVLKANATKAEIETLCEEAKQHHFKAVCVNGFYVPLVSKLLQGTAVRIACVVGFPLGQMTSGMKAAEAAQAVKDGAHEIDMVLNVGAMKDRDYQTVFDDIQRVKTACGPSVTLKVIFETCLLDEEQIIDASILSVAAGAEFVKTSTGFSTGGATPEAIDCMLAAVGNAASVKASGGVRDLNAASQYVAVGVDRIGTSSGVAIVTGGSGTTGY
eukprot:gene10855-7521_t